MKTKNIILSVIGIAIGIAIYLLFFNSNKDKTITKTILRNTTNKERKVLYWRAPMNANEVYDKPGKSNMGMDLVPVYENQASGAGVVKIDPVVQQNMNVKIEEIKLRVLSTEVITNGVLTTDETREYIATSRVTGWIEKLYINYNGQKINKGDKLMKIYSPQLVAAQQELLTAISYNKSIKKNKYKTIDNNGNDLVSIAVRKLQLYNVPLSEIEKIKKTRKVSTYLTLYAKKSGTVLEKAVIEGAKVSPGTLLCKIADLTNVWLLADIYEYELSKIDLGSKAEIIFNFMPGKVYRGKISFIYPTLDPKTRTAKIRIELQNKNGELKPAMFANVVIKGKKQSKMPAIPETAIIRNGMKNIAIISLGDGKFKPVEIKIGIYSDGYYQVLSGLNQGDKIVTSAQFLIDSESNLNAALNQFKSSEAKTYKLVIDENDTTKTESELIRKGIIHLETIDENKDGKLYQDIMDWNVISDKPGVCPECGMTLREFTIKEVKENLRKHGYKFK